MYEKKLLAILSSGAAEIDLSNKTIHLSKTIEIRRSVSIRGAQAKIFGPPGKQDAFRVSGSLRMEGVSLSSSGPGALLVVSGEATLVKCELVGMAPRRGMEGAEALVSQMIERGLAGVNLDADSADLSSTTGVVATGKSRVKIHECNIMNHQNGIVTQGRASVHLERSVFSANTDGLQHESSGTSSIVGCTFRDNDASGVEVTNGDVTIESSEAAFNAAVGFSISGKASLRVISSVARSNKYGGIRILDGTAHIEKCRCVGHEDGSGIFVFGGQLTATKNECNNNRNGIHARDNFVATLERNACADNENFGIFVEGAEALILRKNRYSKNGVAGAGFFGHSRVVVENDSYFYQNLGILASNRAAPSLKGCFFSSNTAVGAALDKRARVTFDSCVFHANGESEKGGCSVLLAQGASAEFLGSFDGTAPVRLVDASSVVTHDLDVPLVDCRDPDARADDFAAFGDGGGVAVAVAAAATTERD